jgi:hypothetical protein
MVLGLLLALGHHFRRFDGDQPIRPFSSPPRRLPCGPGPPSRPTGPSTVILSAHPYNGISNRLRAKPSNPNASSTAGSTRPWKYCASFAGALRFEHRTWRYSVCHGPRQSRLLAFLFLGFLDPQDAAGFKMTTFIQRPFPPVLTDSDSTFSFLIFGRALPDSTLLQLSALLRRHPVGYEQKKTTFRP